MNDNISTNEVNAISDTFEWKFKKFSANDYMQPELLSSIFTIEVRKKVFKWQIGWTLRDDRDEEYSSFMLISLNESDVEAKYTFYLIDNENKKLLFENSGKHIFGEYDRSGFERLMKFSSIENKKNFSILCNITINTEISNILEENAQSQIKSNNRRLQELDSLEKLLEDDKFSDITFYVKGQLFPAHKCIVSNRCRILAIDVENFNKKKSKYAVVYGVEPHIFKEVLRFIYIGRVDKIKKIAIDLYIAAYYYLLEGLQDLCVEYLKNTISVKNAVKYLEFADNYGLNELEQKVLDFMVKYPKDIIDLPEFKEMGIEEPELSFKLLRALALKMETLTLK